MSNKKPKKRNAGPPKPMIQLSQCMIVKNEEKNIERALRWAKGVAFEQIVVDTGSTDRTVELAEKMGAKVYHFQWIGDFSAAKNYAIEQATGNWIAFLDADEYFSPEDARTLMFELKRIHSEPLLREQYFFLMCPMVQIEDGGGAGSVNEHIRVFRNLPIARYEGKIHEKFMIENKNIIKSDRIRVIHTGYSESAYSETGKAGRNIEMLRAELAERPDDLSVKANLAESLRAQARLDEADSGAASLAEAKALYGAVAASDGAVEPWLRKRAHIFTIEQSMESGVSYLTCRAMCERALQFFPGDLDLEYFLASVMNKTGDHRSAWEVLLRCEEKYVNLPSLEESQYVVSNPGMFFREMLVAAAALKNTEGIVKYATMMLIGDKTLQDILGLYIATLLQNGAPEPDVVALLSKIYDMGDPKDLLFVARTAKECGAIGLSRTIIGMAEKLI